MTDKRKKRTRALAEKLSVSYQAAHNILQTSGVNPDMPTEEFEFDETDAPTPPDEEPANDELYDETPSPGGEPTFLFNGTDAPTPCPPSRARPTDYARLPPEALSWTLEQGIRWVQENSDRGFHCPACMRFGKNYWRKINSSMAYCLILLFRFYRDHPEHAGRFIHMNGYIASLTNLPSRVRAAIRGDFTKLRFWGFVEAMDEFRDDGSARNGYWRITETGRQFAQGLIQAPARIRTYNDELLGMDTEETVTIQTALGTRFNYDELMCTSA